MTWVRLAHALGLTNLADADVDRYEEQQRKVVSTPSERILGTAWWNITFVGESITALRHTGKLIEYGVTLVSYFAIFATALLTVSLLEVRQANVQDFDALAALLEQRDLYHGRYFDRVISEIQKDREQYQRFAAEVCADGSAHVQVSPAEPPSKNQAADQSGSVAEPKSCAEIKAVLAAHLNELISTEDKLLFERAYFTKYYDDYLRGILEKSPTLIPLVGIVNSGFDLLAIWARAPIELLELSLIVCMGALGGAISAIRQFLDPEAANPSTLKLYFRPAAGVAVALGIYIVVRATQLLFASQMVFPLAGLGLISGFRANEILRRIDLIGKRLVHRADISQTAARPSTDVPDRRSAEVPNPLQPREHPRSPASP